MFIRKSLIIILGISLLAVAAMVYADDVPTRHFGTPHGSMRYDMRSDNDLRIKNPPTVGHENCKISYYNICWAHKLPPHAIAKF